MYTGIIEVIIVIIIIIIVIDIIYIYIFINISRLKAIGALQEIQRCVLGGVPDAAA